MTILDTRRKIILDKWNEIPPRVQEAMKEALLAPRLTIRLDRAHRAARTSPYFRTINNDEFTLTPEGRDLAMNVKYEIEFVDTSGEGENNGR